MRIVEITCLQLLIPVMHSQFEQTNVGIYFFDPIKDDLMHAMLTRLGSSAFFMWYRDRRRAHHPRGGDVVWDSRREYLAALARLSPNETSRIGLDNCPYDH